MVGEAWHEVRPVGSFDLKDTILQVDAGILENTQEGPLQLVVVLLVRMGSFP
jgi:hypothetical protein